MNKNIYLTFMDLVECGGSIGIDDFYDLMEAIDGYFDFCELFLCVYVMCLLIRESSDLTIWWLPCPHPTSRIHYKSTKEMCVW